MIYLADLPMLSLSVLFFVAQHLDQIIDPAFFDFGCEITLIRFDEPGAKHIYIINLPTGRRLFEAASELIHPPTRLRHVGMSFDAIDCIRVRR